MKMMFLSCHELLSPLKHFILICNNKKHNLKYFDSPVTFLFEPRREKTCLRVFANNTGADQPAHPRSLISAFVIRVLESTIFKLATSEISVF